MPLSAPLTPPLPSQNTPFRSPPLSSSSPSFPSSSYFSSSFSLPAPTSKIPGDSLAFLSLLNRHSGLCYPFFNPHLTYLASITTICTESAHQAWQLSANYSMREESPRRYHQKRISGELMPKCKQSSIPPYHHQYRHG